MVGIWQYAVGCNSTLKLSDYVIFRQFNHIVLGSAVLLEPGAGVGTL